MDDIQDWEKPYTIKEPRFPKIWHISGKRSMERSKLVNYQKNIEDIGRYSTKKKPNAFHQVEKKI